MKTNLHRIHPKFRQFGTITGRLAGSGNFSCYSLDTEVLTQSGWKFIKDINLETDKVWQVNQDNEGSWTIPLAFIQTTTNRMVRIGSYRMGELLVSDDHKMLWFNYRGEFDSIEEASKGVKQSRAWIARASNPIPTKEIDPELLHTLRSAIMIQADGTKSKTKELKWRLAFKKQRKVERLFQLYPYARVCRYKDYHIFLHIPHPTQFLTPNKLIDLKSLSGEYAEAVYEELRHWDGWYRNTDRNAMEYCSTVEHNIDEYQAYFARSGYFTCKRNKNRLYIVRRTFSEVKKKLIKIEEVPMTPVVCLSVKEGFLLIRRNGHTWVSGNCTLRTAPDVM